MKRILGSPYFWTLVASLFVAIPLLLVGLNSAHIVEIYILPDSEDAAKITCKSAVTRVYRGPSLFDFCAELTDSSIQKVTLNVRPTASAVWYGQGSWRAEGGTVRGVVHLGSEEWPMKEDEDYSFQLVAEDGRTLVNGKIIARVTELAVRPSWLILALGVLASVIQIGQTLFLAVWKKDSLPAPHAQA